MEWNDLCKTDNISHTSTQLTGKLTPSNHKQKYIATMPAHPLSSFLDLLLLNYHQAHTLTQRSTANCVCIKKFCDSCETADIVQNSNCSWTRFYLPHTADSTFSATVKLEVNTIALPLQTYLRFTLDLPKLYQTRQSLQKKYYYLCALM